MMKSLSQKLLLPLFLLTFIFTTSISAQDLDDVTISGKVTDSNNLAIIGATVTATLAGNKYRTNGDNRR